MNESRAGVPWTRVCYAADAGPEGITFVRAVRGRGRVDWRAVAAGDPSLRRELEAGIPCVAALSCRESFTRGLEAPFSATQKGAKVLPTLLDIQLPFPLEACVYQFLDLRRTSQKTTRAVAVCARETDAARRLALLSEVNVDPVVLDQEGLALWTQSLREAPPAAGEQDAFRVLVHLRAESAVAVIGRGEEFLGAHSLSRDIVSHLGRLLRAYGPEAAGNGAGGPEDAAAPRTAWFWAGAGADRSAVAAMQGALAEAWPGRSVIHDDPATFLVRALATRALLPGPLRCNLRTGRLAHPRMAREAGRRSATAAGFVGAAGLVLCALSLTAQWVAGSRVAGIERAFDRLAGEMAGYPLAAKGADALRTVRRIADERQDELRPFVFSFEPSFTRVIGSVLETGRERGLRYEMLSVSREGILLSGVAPDWNASTALLPVLRRAGFDVRLDRHEAVDDEGIPFTITSGETDE